MNYLSDLLPTLRGATAPRSLLRLRIWIVEAFGIALALWLWRTPSHRMGLFWAVVLLLFFGVVVVIDIEHRLILFPVTLVGAGIALVVGAQLHGILSTLLGGLAGFGIMLALYYFGAWVANLLARWRGQELSEVALGFGDVNLSGVIGLLLGWPGVLAGITVAIFLGGFVSLLHVLLSLLLRRYRFFAAIPYGPFLVAGAVILLFFRDIFLS